MAERFVPPLSFSCTDMAATDVIFSPSSPRPSAECAGTPRWLLFIVAAAVPRGARYIEHRTLKEKGGHDLFLRV